MVILGIVRRRDQHGAVDLKDVDFGTSTGYLAGSAMIVGALIALYWAFW